MVAHQMPEMYYLSIMTNERTFKGTIEKLNSPERRAMLEVERVVELCLEQLFVTKVLDIGCGSGIFAEAFAVRNMHVTGIDSNPEMVAFAKDHVPDASFREGSAESLPFADKSFDIVFMGHLLHESDTPGKVLAEARRVAKYRVAILEWPYRTEAFGPPLSHRMDAEAIKRLAHKAGLIQFQKTELQQMVFYRMTPKC